MRRLTLAFAAVVVLAPMIQSWYVVWLIPLFAVTGIRDDWQVKALYFIVSFFMVYAISDQLEVFPYLQTDDLGLALALARNAAAIIALLFAPVPDLPGSADQAAVQQGGGARHDAPDHLGLQVSEGFPARERAEGRAFRVTNSRTHSGSVLAYSRSAQPMAFRIKNSGSAMFASMTARSSPVSVADFAPSWAVMDGPPDPEVLIGAPLQQDTGKFLPVGLQQSADPVGHPVHDSPTMSPFG